MSAPSLGPNLVKELPERPRPQVIEARAKPEAAAPKRLSIKTMILLATLVVWIICWALFKGKATLALGTATLTDVHRGLNDFNEWIGSGRDANPWFIYLFNPLRAFLDTIANFFTETLAVSSSGKGYPNIGWLGVVAIATWISYTIGNVRVAILTLVGLILIGLQDLWVPAMQTLALTLTAVLISLVLAIPLGIWAGVSNRFNKFVTPVLDFMQILPSYVYLLPLTLFFAIGPAAAVVATVIYAAPPTIRITAHGIRQVPTTTVEAVDSLGVTGWQRLRTVLLPMSKRTIVIGINQTIMAALAMVTIAALIAAPGLGQIVLRALQSLNIGTAFNAGLAIVLMAIILDRSTTAASVRAELGARAAKGRNPKIRWSIIGGGLVVTAVAIYLSQTQLWAAVFPNYKFKYTADSNLTSVGGAISDGTANATTWIQDHFSGLTSALREGVTSIFLNPLESLLVDTPFFVVGAVLVIIAVVVAGTRPGIITALALIFIGLLGMWSAAMATLAAVLVATVITMIIAVIIGTLMGRSKRADTLIRPILDGAQTLPAFVYLIPFLALFGPTRFTAIVAAVVYAAPASIKIVADGIRGVSPTTLEAATSCGSSTWQLITKVQIPMASKSLALATNQGIIYVLSMVVVGGLVGAGALGYLVVSGFVQLNLYGKGLAAGVAIVLLGVTLDRVTQAATSKSGR